MNIIDDVNLEIHQHGQVLDVIELTYGKDYYRNGATRKFLNINYGIGTKVNQTLRCIKWIPDGMKENKCATVVFSDSELMLALEYYYMK